MTTTHTAGAPADPQESLQVTDAPAAEAEAQTEHALAVRGAQLSEDETAALVAVLARLAAAEPVPSDAGGTGPTDRAVQRRHRLQLDQHGLWGRPGPSSWQAAGGIG